MYRSGMLSLTRIAAVMVAFSLVLPGPQPPRRPRRHPPTSCWSRWPKPPTASDRWRPRDGRPPAVASGPAAPWRPTPPSSRSSRPRPRGAALAVVAAPARPDRAPRAARAPEHGCGAGLVAVPGAHRVDGVDRRPRSGPGRWARPTWCCCCLGRTRRPPFGRGCSCRLSMPMRHCRSHRPRRAPRRTPRSRSHFRWRSRRDARGHALDPHGEPGPHPAVVLMTGSGPQDRDESLPGLILKPFAITRRCACQGGRGRPALRRPRHRALHR